MKNNIYELLNDLKVDFNYYDYDEKGEENISDIEKLKVKRRIRKLISRKNLRKRIMEIATIIICVIGVITYSEGQSVFADAGRTIEELLHINDDIGNYKTIINSSVSDKDIEIKLNDIVLSDDLLITSVEIKGKTKLKENDRYEILDEIKINAEPIEVRSTSIRCKKIDDYTIREIFTYRFADNQEKKIKTYADVNIDFNIYKIALDSDNRESEHEENITAEQFGFKEGKWNFNIITNKYALQRNYNRINLDKNQIMQLKNKEKIILKEYISNSLQHRIVCKVKDYVPNNYVLGLKGTDDKGNKVMFFCYNYKENEVIFDYDLVERGFDENASVLKLTPYVCYDANSEEADFEKCGDEFTIKIK